MARKAQSGADGLAETKLTFEAVLDALADRIAAKVRPVLAEENGLVPIKPRLLTVNQAGIYLGRSKEAVQHLVSSGKLPTVRTDRRVFIDVLDLDRLIEENKRTGI